MDTVTHAALGALLVAAVPRIAEANRGPSRARYLLVGAVAAMFPDSDYGLFWLDPLHFHAYWHRGITHSLLMLPLWATLLATGWSICWRQWRAWLNFFLVSTLAIGSHIGADLTTVYGTQLWSPFSDTRYSLSSNFVVDPVFSALVLIPLSLNLKRAAPALARVASGLLICYVAGQFVASQYARQLADRHGQALGLAAFDSYALPQPGSPAHRLLIIRRGEDYWLARVNLLAGEPAVGAPAPESRLGSLYNAYHAPVAAPWQRRTQFGRDPRARALATEVWWHSAFSPVRDFARLPALSGIEEGPDETCVWFTDLRYDWPTIRPPFVYGMCRAFRGPWQLYRKSWWTDATVAVPAGIAGIKAMPSATTTARE